LVGCASPASKPVTDRTSSDRIELRNGVWFGTIPTVGIASDDTNIAADGQVMSSNASFLVSACNGKGIFLLRRKDGKFLRPVGSETYRFHSNHGNHIIYFDSHGGDTPPNPEWAETQSVELVELKNGALRVHWSRAVGNLQIPEDDKYRDFFWHGVGTLRQVSDKCPD
jgi:hypothetical protein